MTTPAAQSSTQSFQVMMKTMLDEYQTSLVNQLKNHMNVQTGDVMQTLNEINTRLAVLEKCQSATKKPINRNKAADSSKDTPTDKPADGSPKVDAPAEAATETTAGKQFPNKMLWFKKKYTEDAVFRTTCNEAVSRQHPNFLQLMEGDKSVSEKTKESAKATARATFAWKFIPANAKAYNEQYDKEYAEAKKQHEQANKPAANQVDAGSPRAAAAP